jgi:hypothetical protein
MMVVITDYKDHKHYISPAAIAKISESGLSSRWRGINCIVKCFDGTIIEAADHAHEIANQVIEQASS